MALKLPKLEIRRWIREHESSHPRAAEYLEIQSQLDTAALAELTQAITRLGPMYFDVVDRVLSNLFDLAPEHLELAPSSVDALLRTIGEATGALPHERDFEAFEDVVESFYEQPVYPLLEHLVFLTATGLIRLEQVLELMPSQAGTRIADVAVGPAVIYTELLRRFPKLSGRAFDISPHCVRYAERMVELDGLEARSEITRADARQLPLDAETLDLIVATEVIEHVADPDVLLAELARVLAPGGHLIASVPTSLPWGPHLSVFESEADVRRLYQTHFEVSELRALPFIASSTLTFARLEKR